MPAKVRRTSSVAVGQYGAEVVAMPLSLNKAILSSHLRSPSTRSSSERGSSSLDDAVAPSFTSSTKRALYGLQTTLESLATTLHGAFMQPLPRRVTSESLAAKRLLESVKSSASSEGGAWLSQPELFEALEMFRHSSFSSIYVEMTEAQEDEDMSREWVRMHLEQARTARTSISSSDKIL